MHRKNQHMKKTLRGDANTARLL